METHVQKNEDIPCALGNLRVSPMSFWFSWIQKDKKSKKYGRLKKGLERKFSLIQLYIARKWLKSIQEIKFLSKIVWDENIGQQLRKIGAVETYDWVRWSSGSSAQRDEKVWIEVVPQSSQLRFAGHLKWQRWLSSLVIKVGCKSRLPWAQSALLERTRLWEWYSGFCHKFSSNHGEESKYYYAGKAYCPWCSEQHRGSCNPNRTIRAHEKCSRFGSRENAER